MKAALLERVREPLAVTEEPAPAVGPDDVLVRVHACGVCHADLHIADGMLEAQGVPLPLLLGHEVAGVVSEVGSEVTHPRPGDRVGMYFQFNCGHCRYCLAGEEEVCGARRMAGFGGAPGGYAEYIVLPAANALPLPEGLDFVDAAPLFCAGLTMFGALKNGGVRPGQRVAVLGIGGLRHLGLALARAMGAEVVALTSSKSKADLARQLGAHEVIAGDGMGQRLLQMGGADVIVSTTIDSGAVAQALQGLAPLGTLVLTGATMDPLPVIPGLLLFQQQRVIGSTIGSRGDMMELLQFVTATGIRPMTETYALDEVNAAHARVRANEIRFRAVLTMV